MIIRKKKVMLHIIMPSQISGPNTSTYRVLDSKLANEYEFGVLVQRFHAGGVISFRLIEDLYRQIEQFNPDLVHISGLQAAGFHAVIAAKLARKKTLLTVHGFSVDALNISSFRKVLYKIMETITLMMSDNIYTVCEFAKKRKEIQRFSSKVLDTVYNIAPKVEESLFQKRNFRRKELGLNTSDILVNISGRMTEDKGILTIIKAIQLQRDRAGFENVRYLFVGDGPCIDEMKRCLSVEIDSGKVICLGKRSDVLELLVASDVFLFATLHENLSNALLEAMSCGLPVIATSVGGNPEVVCSNVNGYLIPANDPSSILESLLYLVSDEKRRQLFGIASKTIISERFSEETLYEKLGTIYKKVL